jgi:hypothetical protein
MERGRQFLSPTYAHTQEGEMPLGLHEPASPHNWTDPDYLKVVAVEKIN